MPFTRDGKINFNQQYYQSGRQASSSFIEKNFITDNKQRQMKFNLKGRSLDESAMKEREVDESIDDDDWQHYDAHRDRRELYHRIEKAASA